AELYIAMAFDPASNGTRAHYHSEDGHVHELFLYGNQWQDADLTAITGGPESFYAIAIAFDPLWNGTRTHYVSYPEGHVHELFVSGGHWQDADLTALTACPTVFQFGNAIVLVAVSPGISTPYFYCGPDDGHVHELFLHGNQWQDADLTAITGGPVSP